MSWTQHLTNAELAKIHQAAIHAGLPPDTLTAGLKPTYRATLPGGPNESIKLFNHLTSMNRVHNLVSGEVPLREWLFAASLLSGGKPEQKKFDDLLDRFSADPAPSVNPPDLSAANLDIQPEALVTGFDESVSVQFLERALKAAKSVVKLVISNFQNAESVVVADGRPRTSSGTGWFIAPTLLITNHHVINSRHTAFGEADAAPTDFELQAENAKLVFDYLSDDLEFKEVTAGNGALLAQNSRLDYALLRVSEEHIRSPLARRANTLVKTPGQALGLRVNILQHPNGSPLRAALRDNFVVVGNRDTLSYLTTTNFGSSGSPVFDDQWLVTALHSGSRAITAQNISIRGRRVSRENFGIPIDAILENLLENHPELHDEMVEAE